jgi:hypothetical protein
MTLVLSLPLNRAQQKISAYHSHVFAVESYNSEGLLKNSDRVTRMLLVERVFLALEISAYRVEGNLKKSKKCFKN